MSAAPRPAPFPRAGVYLIADTAMLPAAALVAAVTAALSAGVKLVQYRHKGPLTREAVGVAGELADHCRNRGALFLVNDRADLALMCGADGVHLGQDDLTVATARRLIGPHAYIGVSTHNRQEAEQAERDGADYLGFGNVFGTATKADALPPVGTGPLAEVCRAVSLPVYAIGGVGPGNLAQVAAAGAAGGAVISAVLGADDPGQAAAELLDCWQKENA
ncbi:MAG: thiamine phosphate synthase [Leptospirillia bacterium]